jgi:hypothetical protein
MLLLHVPQIFDLDSEFSRVRVRFWGPNRQLLRCPECVRFGNSNDVPDICSLQLAHCTFHVMMLCHVLYGCV